jgi:hypothetical protein
MRAVNLVFAASGGCALVVAVDCDKCVLHGVGDSDPTWHRLVSRTGSRAA